MYTKACGIYWGVTWQVGGGRDAESRKLHGMGCLLTADHILTARHVWKEIEHLYDWPMVLKHDGLFRCDVIYEWPEYDVALLEARQRLKRSDHGSPQGFPRITSRKPALGLSVGYISALHLYHASGDYSRHTSFFQAAVSFRVVEDGAFTDKFALTGGVMQGGFSGGPVFTPDGSLVGLLVETLQWGEPANGGIPYVNTLPVMSPLYSLRQEIEKNLGT